MAEVAEEPEATEDEDVAPIVVGMPLAEEALGVARAGPETVPTSGAGEPAVVPP